MSNENPRFMRILVFFDLPVVKKEQRKIYTRFRNFLLKDGYYMLQFSVYVRICRGRDSIEKHLNRLKLSVPAKGSVRYLLITDKQYNNMGFLVSKPKVIKKLKKKNADQLVLF